MILDLAIGFAVASQVEPPMPAVQQTGRPVENYIVVAEAPSGPRGQAWHAAAWELARYRQADVVLLLNDENLNQVLRQLQQATPEWVAWVVLPERIDDNFVGRVFEGLTKFDEDPFLDCKHGFLTGRTGEDLRALIQNTIRAETDPESVKPRFAGIGHTFSSNDLGPFATEQQERFHRWGFEGVAVIGVDDSQTWEKSRAQEVQKLNGSSVVFAAGHGMGDWMCAIPGELLQDLRLNTALVINGTCHSLTTMTRHDIDPETMKVVCTSLDPNQSIALNFIAAGAIAQLGSTASSSWMNVGPTMDGILHKGQAAGTALSERLNAYIEQWGIQKIDVIPFVVGCPSPQFLPQEREKGAVQSISRVCLFGDPAYRPFGENPIPRFANSLKKDGRRPATVDLQHYSVEELIAEILDPQVSSGFEALNQIIEHKATAVDPLIGVLQNSNNWQIPKALGQIRDQRALDPLIKRLDNTPSKIYQQVVVEALQEISGVDFGSNAVAWRDWREEQTEKE